MVKKIAISLSVLMNVVVIATVIYFWAGGAVKYFQESFIKPGYDRWVSQKPPYGG